jgi:CYTH domain-containing protein
MEISPEIAKTLFEGGSGYGIYKYRYVFSESASGKFYTIEVDEFRGLNKGLLMAEIEFKSEKDAKEFNPLDLPYLVKEVTDDPKYRNDYLNKKPYSTW